VAAAPKTVLVVDDEPDIVDLLRYNLTREGYRVETASNGEEALRSVAAKAPDLIVLDLMMPVLDVIFLTARSAEVDEVVGLELGADDYIQKPISPRKLVARVKAVFRRREGMQEPGAPEVIRAEHIEINRTTYTVRLAGKEAFFPRKEFELLSLLAGHPGKVFSREMLLNAIWGSDVVVVDRTVDVHIRKIREKLGDAAGMIETVKGVGYRFRE
jgi:two-component system alkaline phosphatase synthesis response regulator PhoP